MRDDNLTDQKSCEMIPSKLRALNDQTYLLMANQIEFTYQHLTKL